MTEMVERVARAMWAERRRHSHANGVYLEEWGEGAPAFGAVANNIMEEARVAIEAMREPTDAMLAACWPHHHPWGKNAPNPAERPAFFQQVILEVSHDWMAMLDAALSETPHEQ